jgi:hypothetical protein
MFSPERILKGAYHEIRFARHFGQGLGRTKDAGLEVVNNIIKYLSSFDNKPVPLVFFNGHCKKLQFQLSAF